MSKLFHLEQVVFDTSLSNIMEADLNAAQRNALKDSDFGLPESRKYPMPDKEHVKLAIKFFRYAKPGEKEELAKNINKKIKAFNMQDEIHVGKDNAFNKYYNK